MKPDYKNWVPKEMVYGFFTGVAVALLLFAVLCFALAAGMLKTVRLVILGIGASVLLAVGIWMLHLHNTFSYEGKRKLIRTCEGMFMEKKESVWLDLAGSILLTGIK